MILGELRRNSREITTRATRAIVAFTSVPVAKMKIAA